jgi:hypothetical protein
MVWGWNIQNLKIKVKLLDSIKKIDKGTFAILKNIKRIKMGK